MLAALVAFFFRDLMWRPMAALTAEWFTPHLRYSGASIGVQLAAIRRLASTGSGQVITLYILGCAIVSIAATAALPSRETVRFGQDSLRGIANWSSIKLSN